MQEAMQEAPLRPEVQGDAPESSPSSSRMILVGGGMMLVGGLAVFAAPGTTKRVSYTRRSRGETLASYDAQAHAT